jgi:hypothetical protein
MAIIKEEYFIALVDEGDEYIEDTKLCDRTFASIEQAKKFFDSQFVEWMKDEGYKKEEYEIVKITTIYERNFSKIS